MRSYQRVGSSDEALSRVQTNIENALSPIASSAILDGKLITAELTTAGANIAHGLGRSYRGYIIVSTGAVSFSGHTYEVASPDDAIYLTLSSTSNVTVTAWVF